MTNDADDECATPLQSLFFPPQCKVKDEEAAMARALAMSMMGVEGLGDTGAGESSTDESRIVGPRESER